MSCLHENRPPLAALHVVLARPRSPSRSSGPAPATLAGRDRAQTSPARCAPRSARRARRAYQAALRSLVGAGQRPAPPHIPFKPGAEVEAGVTTGRRHRSPARPRRSTSATAPWPRRAAIHRACCWKKKPHSPTTLAAQRELRRIAENVRRQDRFAAGSRERADARNRRRPARSPPPRVRLARGRGRAGRHRHRRRPSARAGRSEGTTPAASSCMFSRRARAPWRRARRCSRSAIPPTSRWPWKCSRATARPSPPARPSCSNNGAVPRLLDGTADGSLSQPPSPRFPRWASKSSA